jgi:uncharacterized protein YcfJ
MQTRSSIRVAVLMLVLSVFAGCAAAPQVASYQPVVDSVGHDPRQIDVDVAYCHSLARRTPAWRTVVDSQNRVAGGILVGALFGAAIGAALGDGFVGHQGSITRFGAGIGAVEGAVYGAADIGMAVEAYKNVVRDCMSNRGYYVYY